MRLGQVTGAPWESRIPNSAAEATAWIRSGWEPTAAQMRAIGPARARAFGLEYVEVTGLSPFGWMVLIGLVVGWFVLQPKRRRHARV